MKNIFPSSDSFRAGFARLLSERLIKEMREEAVREFGDVAAAATGAERASGRGHVVAARLKKFRLRAIARRRSSLRQQRAEGGGSSLLRSSRQADCL
jgi:hypothetical protein